jgi:AcrR family transcriptional regulator
MSAAPPAGRRPGRPPSLTREQVARAALAEGFDELSMPSVARRLGVSHSTLYRYVTDRRDLVSAALDIAIAEHEWPSTDLDWRPLLEAFADALWALADAHPGLAEAALELTALPERVVALLGAYATRLRELGFTSRDAVVALDFIADLTFSTAITMRDLDAAEETPDGPRTRRELYRDSLRGLAGVTPEIDDDATWRGRGFFDDKLAIMLDGLELRLGRR